MKISELYQKVESFDQANAGSYRPALNCKKGCAKCCQVELTVFEIEANSIRHWFTNLDSVNKDQLLKSWADHKEGCSFLVQDACTIYPARPLICRTQGLPLAFKIENEQFVDICPLNEEALLKVSSLAIMNLDLINTILAQFETSDAQGLERPRIALKDLRAELLNQFRK